MFAVHFENIFMYFFDTYSSSALALRAETRLTVYRPIEVCKMLCSDNNFEKVPCSFSMDHMSKILT